MQYEYTFIKENTYFSFYMYVLFALSYFILFLFFAWVKQCYPFHNFFADHCEKHVALFQNSQEKRRVVFGPYSLVNGTSFFGRKRVRKQYDDFDLQNFICKLDNIVSIVFKLTR